MNWELKPVPHPHLSVAELVAGQPVVINEDAGKDLLANAYYAGHDGLVLHQHQLCPDFFQLESGLAGSLLQLATNFRLRLAIVGHFDGYDSKSLAAFITESNRVGKVIFVPSVEQALSRWQ